jgi:hypothetical protein
LVVDVDGNGHVDLVPNVVVKGRSDDRRDDQGEDYVHELVEPSLFFAKHPPAADRFLARRLET